jgi:hypothetical protein
VFPESPQAKSVKAETGVRIAQVQADITAVAGLASEKFIVEPEMPISFFLVFTPSLTWSALCSIAGDDAGF